MKYLKINVHDLKLIAKILENHEHLISMLKINGSVKPLLLADTKMIRKVLDGGEIGNND